MQHSKAKPESYQMFAVRTSRATSKMVDVSHKTVGALDGNPEPLLGVTVRDEAINISTDKSKARP